MCAIGGLGQVAKVAERPRMPCTKHLFKVFLVFECTFDAEHFLLT